MFKKIFVVNLVSLIVALLPYHPCLATSFDKHQEKIDEIFDLNAGARVSIHGINGPVHVETWNQPKAEIHIVKSTSEDPEELKRLDVIIEHTADSLEIRTRKGESHDGPHVRTSVDAKLPRRMDLTISGVNGSVEVAAVEGPFEAHGINGRVRIDQATDRLKVSGVNGSVRAAMLTLGGEGIQISGVNGSIEISLPDSVNADIDVTGHNGGVNTDLKLTVTGKLRRNEFHAQMGSGGTPIRMSGINGSINLSRSSM